MPILHADLQVQKLKKANRKLDTAQTLQLLSTPEISRRFLRFVERNFASVETSEFHRCPEVGTAIEMDDGAT